MENFAFVTRTYISDFLNISTYQQKTTIIATYTIKKGGSKTHFGTTFPLLHSNV